MKKVIYWDKKSPINRVSADVYLAANPHYKDEDLLLVLSADGKRVERIEEPAIISSIYELNDFTNEEIRAWLESYVNQSSELIKE